MTLTLIKPAVEVQPHAVLETASLSLSYGARQAFCCVSMPIWAGKITALIGPSGCGKTSYLQCLNRLTDLIPDCAVQGSIQFLGQDLRAATVDVTALRRRVGMIFQKPNPFPLSIRRNLTLALQEIGVREKSALDSVVECVLTETGLWDEVKDRLDSPAQTLSGGQQQRLCIARALALKPEVLLMDEPCSALDPISSGVVEDLIRRLRGRYTVVIVTHNLAQARRISDFTGVFWVKDGIGRLVEYGATPQVFGAPQEAITAAYIEGRKG